MLFVGVFFATVGVLFIQMLATLAALSLSERLAMFVGWLVPVCWAFALPIWLRGYGSSPTFWAACFVAMILPPSSHCRGDGAEAGLLGVILMTAAFFGSVVLAGPQ